MVKSREKLETVLKKASAMNGKKYGSGLVDLLFAEEEVNKEGAPQAKNYENKKSEQKANIFSLFNPKRPRLLFMTLNICWIWLVIRSVRGFQMRSRISIRGYVRRSVRCRSVCRSAGLSVRHT